MPLQPVNDAIRPQYPSHYDIPNIDLLTLLFDPEYAATTESSRLFIDAADPTRLLTKAEARTLLKRVAYGLRHQYGIGSSGPGKDVVVVFSRNSYVLPIVFYAVIAAGGIYSAASPASSVPELSRQINQGEPKVVICGHDLIDTAAAAISSSGISDERLLVLDAVPGISLTSRGTGRSCIDSRLLDWRRITDQQELEDTLICILYSSGTTGLPKGVCSSHRNFVAATTIGASRARHYRSILDAAGVPAVQHRVLAHLPCSHIAGVLGYFINPIVGGGEIFWMTKYSFPEFIEHYRRHQITILVSVPPIFLTIANSPLVTDHFDSVLLCVTTAAPMGKELQDRVARKIGKGEIPIIQTWGMTEATGTVTTMAPGYRDDTGSVSSVIPNLTIKTIDEAGNDIPEDSLIPGEVLVKGPVLFKGYFRNEEATRNTFTEDGWYRTGDVGYLQDGLLYLVDRKKELIKYKGNQVAPAELEAVLLSHPSIADAAVTGIDGEGTELPRAYVVRKFEEKMVTAAEVQKFVKERVASYKQLRGGVVFIKEIPKSISGKILRRQLKEMAKQEMKAGSDGMRPKL